MAQQAVWHLKRVTLQIPLATLRGRAWVMALPILIGVIGALVATQLQTREYRGQAQVSVDPFGQNDYLATAMFPFNAPDLYAERLARLARSPALAARVVGATHVRGLTPTEFLKHSSATLGGEVNFASRLAVESLNLLTLSVTYRPRPVAIRLANAYATEFVDFKHERDSRKVEKTLRAVQAVIEEYRARGTAGSSAYETLVQYRLQLEALGLQLQKSTHVTRSAESAVSFRPHALRNGLVGGALGALLGVVLILGVAALRRPRH